MLLLFIPSLVPELEPVAGEREGGRAVPVGVVQQELGDLGYTHVASGLSLDVDHAFGLQDLVERLGYLGSQER